VGGKGDANGGGPGGGHIVGSAGSGNTGVGREAAPGGARVLTRRSPNGGTNVV